MANDHSSDGKLYYRIGEVSRITGVKPYVLRYWESEFRWMSPQKSRSKQRLYRRKDIDMIQTSADKVTKRSQRIEGLGFGEGAEDKEEIISKETPEPRLAVHN